MNRIPFLIHYILLFLLVVSSTGCNKPRGEEVNPTLNVTQAYQTVEARLTQAATQTKTVDTLQPSKTPEETGLETPTLKITLSTVTPSGTTQAVPTTALCDQATAGNPIDITIPDDTQMQPGQNFTKTWRLQNSGTCTWTKDYTIGVFSGEAMGAPSSIPLPQKVEPGQSVDISVDMVAPLSPGTYQSNWKLRNTSSTWFGIGPGGGSPFWVRIIVSGSVTSSVTFSPTPSTPYPPGTTPTPTTSSGNAIALIPNDKINLDNLQLNPGTGEDIGYLPNANGKLSLAPLGSSLISVYGVNTPTLANCQSAPLGNSPLLVKDMSGGLYLCYRTDQGFYGWIRLLSQDPVGHTLILQAQTWN